VLAISPAPGTPDASPQTQISILGTRPALIRKVDVRAQLSGPHPGRLRAYSGARGASFVPAEPFTEGERVRVTLQLRGRKPRRWSFDIARTAPAPPILNITTTQPGKLEQFATEPALSPPRITVRRHGAAGDGSIFLTPLPSPVVHPGSTVSVTLTPVGPGGPMIVDGRGRLVWFRQLTPPDVAANLRVQRYRGRRVLTWWQGPVTAAAYGLGEGVIADRSYRTIKTVHAGNGYAMDLHELTLTPAGDALFTIYSRVVHDGTPLLDAIVQQVDVATGLVVWEWHALGHIPLSESYATAKNSAFYDAFHINSIQALPRGRVLISARDTSAVYEIARAGSRILWTLGGKASDFRLGRGARFWFQHDAQLEGRRVSVFDDEAGPPQKAPSSRGLILRLDRRRHRATVVRALHRSNTTSAQSEGSVQALPGGGHFVGFGAEPWFSQFAADGRLVFDARLPNDDGSYRAYRFPWHARPATRPVAAAAEGAVYASWNGATEVAAWQVLAGDSPATLQVVGTAPRRGFETQIRLPRLAPSAQVRALDATGAVLAQSRVVSS
jgi:hypothetical protein